MREMGIPQELREGFERLPAAPVGALCWLVLSCILVLSVILFQHWAWTQWGDAVSYSVTQSPYDSTQKALYEMFDSLCIDAPAISYLPVLAVAAVIAVASIICSRRWRIAVFVCWACLLILVCVGYLRCLQILLWLDL